MNLPWLEPPRQPAGRPPQLRLTRPPVVPPLVLRLDVVPQQVLRPGEGEDTLGELILFWPT